MAEQTPDIVPELAELRKPYVLPMPDPFRTQTSAAVTGETMPKIDTTALGKAGTRERLEKVRQQQSNLTQQDLESKGYISQGEQQIAEYKTKGLADITKQEGGQARGIYQSVETFREKNPAPELAPTKDNIQSLSTLFGLIGVIGMAMGGSGKQSATASLNAMGGMMKGWQQGRADLWKREVQEFDKNMLTWKAKLDDAMKKAEAAYKILPYNRAEAESKLNEIISIMGSAVLKEKNRQQGFTPTYQLLENLAKDADSAIKESGVERRHRESMEARKTEASKPNYQFYASGDKVIAVNTKDPSDIKEVTNKELAASIKLGTPPKASGANAAQGTAIRVMQQDIGNAKYNLEDLKEAGEKAGKLPGGSVAFANYFKGDIKSDIIRYATNQFVETDLQSNDALMLNLAFDIASAQSGGRGQLSDAKVRAVVAQMPLDEQPEDTKATKWAALMTRVNEANKSMPDDKRVEIPKKIQEYYMGRRLGRGENDSESGQTDNVTGLPLKNSKGWTLEGDGKGNYAYVSPDRKKFEEAE